MKVEAIPTGPFEAICYTVHSGSGRAAVIDPGFDAAAILTRLDALEVKVAAYVCTHGHMDHIHALADLHAARPAPVIMHSQDQQWAFGPENSMEPFYTVPRRPDVTAILPLESRPEWRFDGLAFRCIETPGHTPGSCCLYFHEAGILISGDTLFKGSCGRTDLPGGNPRRMRDSLRELRRLPEDVRVYPGHGPDTTIGIERASNYFMQQA